MVGISCGIPGPSQRDDPPITNRVTLLSAGFERHARAKLPLRSHRGTKSLEAGDNSPLRSRHAALTRYSMSSRNRTKNPRKN